MSRSPSKLSPHNLEEEFTKEHIDRNRNNLSLGMDKLRTQMSICAEIVQKVRHSDNAAEIFETIATKLLKNFQAVHVSIYKLDKSSKTKKQSIVSGKIVAKAIAPYCESCSQVYIENILSQEYQWGQGITGTAIDFYSANLTQCDLNLDEIFAGKAFLLIPIFLPEANQDRPLWGFLTVHQCSGFDDDCRGNWDQDDVLMLKQVATQIEITLQREFHHNSMLQQLEEADQAYAILYRWTEQYRTLVEQIPCFSYVSPIDNTSEFAYISPQIQEFLGVSASKWNAGFFNRWEEYIHPEDRDRIQQKVRKTIETGEPFCGEYRMITRDNKIIWVHDNANIGLAIDGKTRVLRGSAFDISDRKKIEQALIKSEGRLAEAQRITKLGNWELNLLTNEIIWSAELFNIFGRNPAVGSPSYQEALQYYAIEDREKLAQAIEYAINTGKSYHLDLRTQQPDGSYRYIETIGHTECGDNGEVIRLYGTAQDISDRKSTEIRLLRNKNLLKLTIDNTPIGIVTFNLEAKFLTVNQSFIQIIGYSAEELINMTALDITHPNSIEVTVSAINRLINNEVTNIQIEKQYVHKNGYTVDTVSHVSLLRSESGNPIQFIASVEDITKRRQTEEKLASAQIAEAEGKVKSEFLAVMSHELRTPINAVIGMTWLLLGTALSPEQQEYVSTIRNGGEILLSVINNILDFSKIESARLELEEQPFNLNQCIEEVLDLMTSRTAEKSLELTALINLDVPLQIVSDYARLRQILVNLISNAIKFTEHGEIVITVDSRLVNQETNTYELLFDIHDTGIGIEATAIAKLFQAFSQANSSITRQYGGTGLGLVICKQLCELMGGEIGVKSTVGKGSTFSFSIQTKAIADENLRLIATDQLAISEALIGKNVLSVNRNPTLQKAISLYSKPWGIITKETYSATEALRAINLRTFDAVLIDRQLEDFDSLELAKIIQEISPYSKIVLLTPVATIASPKLDIFAATINKPITSSKLYQAFLNIFTIQTPSPPFNLPSPSEYSPISDKKFAEQYPLHILVVEDNPANRRLLLLTLEKLGYKVKAVENGLEAFNELTEKSYDLIFMDVQMPIMDGLIASRNIRQLPDRHPWIIGLSANAFPSSRDAALDAGMDEYLTKPLQSKDLLAALQRVPQRKQPQNSSLDLATLNYIEDSIGKQHLSELIHTYLEHSTQAIANMKEAVKSNDFATIASENHTLKGGAGTFGAIQLCRICQELQTLLTLHLKSNNFATKDIAKIAKLLKSIEAEYSSTYQALQSIAITH